MIKPPPHLPLLALLLVIVALLFATYSNTTNSEGKISSTEIAGFLASCSSGNDTWKCWENSINSTIKAHGVASAFELISAISQKNPEFAAGCHGFAHSLGRTAYELFSERKDFSLSEKASYCNWGFYHGFMEALSEDGGTSEDAKRFCTYVDQKLSGSSQGASLACYHGVGHGASNNHDPKNWGNYQAMVDTAIETCQKASGDSSDLDYCLSGVFMGINELSLAGTYELSVDQTNPLGLCRKQKEQYQLDCYMQGYVLLNSIFKDEPLSSIKQVGAIPEDSYAREALKPVLASLYSFSKSSSSQIELCQSVQERLRIACIEGLAQGIMEKGDPGTEYQQGVSFCSEKSLSQSESLSCYKHVFGIIGSKYPRQKASEICQEVSPDLRSLCTY